MHNELQALAFGVPGEGPPAKLHLGSRVISCDADSGTYSLSTGETCEADLLVAADGIHVSDPLRYSNAYQLA